MITKVKCKVVLSDDSPLDHCFVKGLTTLKEKMFEIDYAFGTITYLNLLSNYLQDEYLFDIKFYGEHKNTPNTLYFMTSYEVGSIKFAWLEEILDYYKSPEVKIVLCSTFGLQDEQEEDIFIWYVMQEDIKQGVRLHQMCQQTCKDTGRGVPLFSDILKSTLDKYHKDFGLEFINKSEYRVDDIVTSTVRSLDIKGKLVVDEESKDEHK